MKYFESLGIFMPQGCAERRGNKSLEVMDSLLGPKKL